MREQQQQVQAFMAQNNFMVDLDLYEEATRDPDEIIGHISVAVSCLADVLKRRCKERPKDAALSRAYLILEETAETLMALDRGDEIELADGLADLAYVVLGTACTFRIPLEEVFDEVHRSNMTKRRGRPDDHLIKASKGTAYSPPDVKGVLERVRR